MDNGTNDMDHNYNMTIRRPSTLVSIKGWGLFYIAGNRVFSAITTTGVDVAITPLTENKDAVTVKVINGAGQEVAVEAQDVLAGVTTLNFKFVKPVTTADLDGVWKVNGTEYSFTAIKLVAAINTAATNDNQVALLTALNNANIENVDETKIVTYLGAIKGKGFTTLAEMQKAVDDANKTAGETAAEAALVKSVQDAKTQPAILSILQENFERVNADWIVKYTSGTTTAAGIKIEAAGTPNVIYTDAAGANAATKAAIQTAIDAVNAKAINDANTAAATAADQAKVTALIQAWVEDDVAPATAKATQIKNSQIKEAVFKVQEATTENALYSALVGLANLDSANLATTDLNAKLAPDYLANKPAVESLGTTANIKTNLVAKADTEALKAAMGKVVTATGKVVAASGDTAANRAELKAGLQKVADVTSHKTGTAKFDMSIIKDENLAKYATAFNTATAISADSTVADLVAKITPVNDAQTLDASLDVINDNVSTTAQVKDALVEIAIGTTLSAGTTADDFIDLSAQAKLEVAELVIEARPTAGYANLDAVLAATDGTGALRTAIDAHVAKVAEFNAIGDLATATTSSIKGELDTYAYDEYVALTSTQKVNVAAYIGTLVNVAADGTETPLNFAGADAVETLAEANAIIDAAIAAIK